jgi:hypothetical protein
MSMPACSAAEAAALVVVATATAEVDSAVAEKVERVETVQPLPQM